MFRKLCALALAVTSLLIPSTLTLLFSVFHTIQKLDSYKEQEDSFWHLVLLSLWLLHHSSLADSLFLFGLVLHS